jgi:pimeloyl-ACP methyl ester carboxylesterase
VRLAGLFQLLPELEQTVGRFPPEVRSVARAGYYRTQTYDTLAAEFATYEQSADQVRTAPAWLEDTPLQVLVAGRYEYPSWCPLSAEQQQDLHQAWLQRQTELAGLSSQGVLTVAENSGHWIQLDHPELVIEAIRQVVERARQSHH